MTQQQQAKEINLQDNLNRTLNHIKQDHIIIQKQSSDIQDINSVKKSCLKKQIAQESQILKDQRLKDEIIRFEPPLCEINYDHQQLRYICLDHYCEDKIFQIYCKKCIKEEIHHIKFFPLKKTHKEKRIKDFLIGVYFLINEEQNKDYIHHDSQQQDSENIYELVENLKQKFETQINSIKNSIKTLFDLYTDYLKSKQQNNKFLKVEVEQILNGIINQDKFINIGLSEDFQEQIQKLQKYLDCSTNQIKLNTYNHSTESLKKLKDFIEIHSNINIYQNTQTQTVSSRKKGSFSQFESNSDIKNCEENYNLYLQQNTLPVFRNNSYIVPQNSNLIIKQKTVQDWHEKRCSTSFNPQKRLSPRQKMKNIEQKYKENKVNHLTLNILSQSRKSTSLTQRTNQHRKIQYTPNSSRYNKHNTINI